MENKYRAYIKWAKLILEVEIIDFKRKRVYCKTEINKPNPCDFYNFDDIILMQYTGLKDKNDVDIYEGDIVKTNLYNINGYVYYSSPSFGIKQKNGVCTDYNWSDFNNFEVVGNIRKSRFIKRLICKI